MEFKLFGRCIYTMRLILNGKRGKNKRHGGLEQFEAYLDKLETSHKKRSPDRPFKCPSSYRTTGSVTIIQTSHPASRTDQYVRSPKLLRLKEQLIQRASGSEWLWQCCNHLFEVIPDDSSSSFQTLREVLERASTNLIVESDGFTGEEIRYWKNQYLMEVFSALIGIIKSHGVGEDGWKSARWIVYDTYEKSIGGISIIHSNSHFDPIAFDEAYGWLQGRQEKIPIGCHFNDVPENWDEYNALLPVLPKGE
ncbi:hypothetical protein M422DRAFT_63060 [Sphaerobolus stellatus SS14]|nr:hypothetical protein M422DRAFT_63060 [Sphaerobolus stellatus SS14]